MLGVMFIKYCIKVADVSLLPQIESANWVRAFGFVLARDHRGCAGSRILLVLAGGGVLR